VSIIAATIPGLATTGWPKLGGNMFNSNYTSASPSLSLSLLKTFNAGGPVFSSPAIDVNGNAYFGSEDGHVYALDKDGNQLWAYQTGGKIDSSPSIASDGTIYIGSNDSNLYALNPNGSVKWTYKATASITSGTSIGADGTVYFVTSDSMLNALVPPGTLKWASKIGRVLYSSPAIASDGTLYIGSIDGYLFSVSSSGNVNWKANYLGVITQPVITPQGWIVCDNSVDFAFAVDSTNTLQWGFDTDGIVDQGGAAVGPDGSSYLGSDSGTLYSISPSGIINWKYSAGAAIVTAPVVDGAGNIYTAVENGKILKLDPTGKLLASYTGSSVLFDRSSPALWSGGRIFIGSGNGSAMQVFN
jgi:outer membrane protein assembly factor BamB